MNYIVDFKNSLTAAEIDQYMTVNGMVKIKEYSFFDRVYLISTESEVTENEFIEKAVLDNGNGIQLLGADINFVRNTSDEDIFIIQDDKNWWKNVVLQNVDFDSDQHTFFREGSNSTVYILDSGINANHSEFVGVDISLLYSVTPSFNDTNGHGTALASIISGKTCGVTNAKIKVVKIFDSSHNTLQSELLTALDEIGIDYVNNGKMPSVLNCSWSIPYNTYINNKIQLLINSGMYVTASAGNNGSPIIDVTPACIPDVFTIGSFGQDLTPSNFSNYTDTSFISFTAGETNYGELDGWAPGENIWSANPNGSFGYIAGTSAAAAIASAAVAYNINKFVDSSGLNFTTFTNINSFRNFLEFNKSLMGKNLEDTNNGMYRILVLDKMNLLDLSDPKYSSSLNRIVGMLGYTEKLDSTKILRVAQAGTLQHDATFCYKNIIRMTSDNDFPEYITFIDNGLMLLNFPMIEDPYNVVEIPITVYYDDNSTVTQSLAIVVFRQDITYPDFENIVLENDPILALTLECLCSSDCCGTNDCVPEYGAGYTCVQQTPGKYGCRCLKPSDMELKENIELINTVDNINIYSFRYKSNPSRTFKGVMAQEILKTKYSNAVSKKNGYYAVNYCMLPANVAKHCEIL